MLENDFLRIWKAFYSTCIAEPNEEPDLLVEIVSTSEGSSVKDGEEEEVDENLDRKIDEKFKKIVELVRVEEPPGKARNKVDTVRSQSLVRLRNLVIF